LWINIDPGAAEGIKKLSKEGHLSAKHFCLLRGKKQIWPRNWIAAAGWLQWLRIFILPFSFCATAYSVSLLFHGRLCLSGKFHLALLFSLSISVV
jgi:hypothetical protein